MKFQVWTCLGVCHVLAPDDASLDELEALTRAARTMADDEAERMATAWERGATPEQRAVRDRNRARLREYGMRVLAYHSERVLRPMVDDQDFPRAPELELMPTEET